MDKKRVNGPELSIPIIKQYKKQAEDKKGMRKICIILFNLSHKI